MTHSLRRYFYRAESCIRAGSAPCRWHPCRSMAGVTFTFYNACYVLIHKLLFTSALHQSVLSMNFITGMFPVTLMLHIVLSLIFPVYKFSGYAFYFCLYVQIGQVSCPICVYDLKYSSIFLCMSTLHN